MPDAVLLNDLLLQELSTYRDLLTLSDQMREALVRREIEVLNEVSKQQAPLLARAGRLEQTGREALEALALRLGMEPGNVTLSSVAEHLAPEAARPLLATRDEITAVVDRLAEANWINAQLLESSMDAIRFTMQLYATGLSAPETGYQESGHPATETPRRAASILLDQRA